MSNTRLVIMFLGGIVLVALGGIIYLSAVERSIPDVLVALATAGLGSLGTLLAKGSSEEPPAAVPPAGG